MAKVFCDIKKCTACKTCEIACAIEHSKTKNLFKAIMEDDLPQSRINTEAILKNKSSLAIACQHCEDAPCIDACISGALYKDKDTGETKCDIDKCVACWMCIMVCPFGVISCGKNNSVKCDLCPERKDFSCVVSCPTGALFSGTREEFKKKLSNLIT